MIIINMIIIMVRILINIIFALTIIIIVTMKHGELVAMA